MRINKKKLPLNLTKALIGFYCGIGIVLYYTQELFMFHPARIEPAAKLNFPGQHREHFIPIDNESTTHVVEFLPASPSKGAVIYFHGNEKNIERYASAAKFFTDRGYTVWMGDYPGFGKSTGEINERALYAQGMQVYKLVNSRTAADSIIIYGRSIGTGIASYVAANVKAKALVLETPYYSIPDLFSAYAPIYPMSRMAKYKLPVYEYLPDVKMPVTIMHGTNDHVIPYSRAAKLKNVLQAKDRFVTFEKGQHNDLGEYRLYADVLDSVLAQ